MKRKKQAKINGLLIKLGFVIFMFIVLLVSWLKGRKEKKSDCLIDLKKPEGLSEKCIMKLYAAVILALTIIDF